MEDKISWSVPVLACAIIVTLVSGFSMLLGLQAFSILTLGWHFLLGCLIGYIVYLFL